ncbi:unnamed protein product [Rhizoctonia solani]|uniref:Ribosomal protein L9 domain-containing protein n=1 Tax=Rhizoctonia solani TaxID=456999 RepID=A0A8H3H666_9AGAM|nr:unnamed protein product [Rhizoctonia solani]
MSKILTTGRTICAGANSSSLVSHRIPLLFARHAHKHRTIEIQLVSTLRRVTTQNLTTPERRPTFQDWEPLVSTYLYFFIPIISDLSHKRIGSVQTVNPGRMRNQLYPVGLAAYIRRGAAPKLLERPRDPNAPLIPDVDFAELELSLRELPNLVFRRRAMKNASTSQQTTAPLNSRAIYGSVTPADVLQRLSDSHHLTLLPPNALLDFKDGSSKLRSTGNHGATVNLRNGAKIPLTITIEGDD